MRLEELKRIVDFYMATGHENDHVVVNIDELSFGPSAFASVVQVYDGFDWEANQIRIKTNKELVGRGNERDAVKAVFAKMEISPRGKETLVMWCPTCQTVVSKKSVRYCSACGQRIDQANPVIL